jgi:hypothetical protein
MGSENSADQAWDFLSSWFVMGWDFIGLVLSSNIGILLNYIQASKKMAFGHVWP